MKGKKIGLILLQVPSDHEHALAVIGASDFLNATETLNTSNGIAVPGEDDIDLKAITNLPEERLVSTKFQRRKKKGWLKCQIEHAKEYENQREGKWKRNWVARPFTNREKSRQIK